MSPLTARDPAGRSIGRIMGGVVPVSLATQILSLVSSAVLARVLGATTSTDAYYLGLSVPVFVYGALVGSLRQSAIPALTSVSDPSSLTRLAAASGELVRGVTVVATLATVLAIGVAEGALPLVAHAQLLSETRLILLELTPYGILGAVTGVLSAILAVRGAFVLPVAVVGLESVVKVALMLAFGSALGVQSLVLGNLVGGAAAVAVLLFAARRRGIVMSWRGRINSPFVRSAVRLSAPLIVSLSVLQVNPVIDRTMTTGLGSGKVTALSLGLRLFVAPAGLVTSLLIAPITATWAARFAEGGWPMLQASARRMVETGARVVPPLVVLGIVLRRQIVDLALAGGAYPVSALRDTAAVLGMSLLALPAQTMVVALAALFVVRRDTVFPMKVAFANVVLNVVLNFAFRGPLGVGGIALSTSLTMSILVLVYLVEVRRRWGGLALEARALVARSFVVAAGVALVSVSLLRVLPHAHSRIDAAAALVTVGTAGVMTAFLILLVAGDPVLRPLSERISHWFGQNLGRRPCHDVLFYLPSVTRMLAFGSDTPAGGAETQIVLLARGLARRGARVALVVEPFRDSLASQVDGVDLVVRPASHANLRLIGRAHEAFAILTTLLRAPSRVVVARVAGQQVGVVGLIARLLGRRFFYSSASDGDFEGLGLRRRDAAMYRIGVGLATGVIVQTTEQRRLCVERFHRDAVVVPSICEEATRARSRDAFLWVGRLDENKQPLEYLALARALPEARFRMVGVPTVRDAALAAAVREEAANLSNVELLGPRPRAAVLGLMNTAVAVVSTSAVEGMPNVFLEGWSRGVPALALSHDPGGAIEAHSIGGVAHGSRVRLIELALELWEMRHGADALGARCVEYARRTHGEDVVVAAWVRALGLELNQQAEIALAGLGLS